MLCYEVSLNGRRLCVAGAPGYGVLGANLTWVKRSPAWRLKGEPDAAFGVEEHTLQVGGLFGEEAVDWIPARSLRTGDVVRIRVLRRASADAPTARRPAAPPTSLKWMRARLARTEDYLSRLRREIREQERRESVKSRPGKTR